MNQFEQQLAAAGARQRRRHLAFAAALLLVALGGVLWYAIATATLVRVLPGDAAATARLDIAKGFAVVVKDRVYGLGAPPVIEVGADGFATAERPLSADERGAAVDVTLAPLPGRLQATTAAQVEDVRWRIDGRLIAKGARLEIELDAGAYVLEADHPHFSIARHEVRLERGRTTALGALDLEPVAGGAEIDSHPAGAAVSVDGQAVGTTPLRLDLSGGRHRVEVRSEGYVPTVETIDVTRAAPQVVRDYHLARPTAELQVAVSPAGGVLLVGGRNAEPGRPLVVDAGIDLAVSYIKAGYGEEKRTLRLGPGETARLDMALKAETGEVVLTSSVPATVRVNGAVRGETPLRLHLQTVAHVLSFAHPGYRTVERRVTPVRGRATAVDVAMVTERAHALATAPQQYTNSAGIALRQFRPGGETFTMGAPRGEPGRRANEFLRQVRLERPFFAGLHEVTNAQFARFDAALAGPDGNAPVTGITWHQAATYCNWLSEREGLNPFYRIRGGDVLGTDPEAEGYRLLSEAEWEWLARRAGKAKASIFAWGDGAVVPPGAGNIADESARGSVATYVPRYTDGHAALAPVGSFAPEASRLHDLFGNVSEWVHDAYSVVPPKPGPAITDPLGPGTGDSHVVKGANWRSASRTELRPAYRQGLIAGRDDVGLRIGRYLYREVSQ